MTVLAIFDVHGDTEELLNSYEKAMPTIVETAPAKPVSHVCARTDSGIRIFDVWQSEEVLQDFVQNPRFQAAITEAGLPQPDVTVLSVHRTGW